MNRQTSVSSTSSDKAESALLGTIMLYPETIHQADGIKAQDFSCHLNATLWTILNRLSNAGKDITNNILIHDELRTADINCDEGWSIRICNMLAVVPNSGGIQQYQSIIKRESFRRRSLMAAVQLSSTLPDSDPYEAMEVFQRGIKQDELSNKTTPAKTMSEIAVEAKDHASRKESRTWETGYFQLDKMMGGMIGETSFTVIAAGPSFGKTALALNLLRNANNLGVASKFLYVSMEMSGVELFDRMVSAMAGIQTQTVRRLRLGLAPKELINKHKEAYDEAFVKLSDTGHIIKADGLVDINEVRSLVARHHGDIDGVVLDYLQQCKATKPGQKTIDRVGEASWNCKDLAVTYKKPVVALSQLSREGYKDGKKPELSHLKESGQLEQDADNVWLLWRKKEEGVASEDIEVNVAKQRGGAIGRFNLNFELGVGRISNLSAKNRYTGQS